MFARSRAPNPDEFASGLIFMDFVTTRRKAAEGLGAVANEYERPSKQRADHLFPRDVDYAHSSSVDVGV